MTMMGSKADTPSDRRKLLTELDSLRELLDEYQDPEPAPEQSAEEHQALKEKAPDPELDAIPVLSDAVVIKTGNAKKPKAQSPAGGTSKNKAGNTNGSSLTHQELARLVDEQVEKALEPLRVELKVKVFEEIMARFPLLIQAGKRK